MIDPSHQPAIAASHSRDEDGNDNSWIGFSDMEKSSFTSLLSLFSTATSFLSHPLTVLSVRQQASSSLIKEAHQIGNVGVATALRLSMGTVGVTGLFRGWLPIATMGVPADVGYYAVIESSREVVIRALKEARPHSSHLSLDFVQAATSSAMATLLARIPFVPAEVISSRLIVQDKAGLGMSSMMRSIYRSEGLRGFYKGFGSSYIVGVIGSTQWWWTYATCRRYAAHYKLNKDYPVLTDSASGFLSGVSAVLLSHPFDTIKTRIMTSSADAKQVLTISSAYKTIKQSYGWKGLYRGLPASLYQTVVGSTIFAASYEFIKISSMHN